MGKGVLQQQVNSRRLPSGAAMAAAWRQVTVPTQGLCHRLVEPSSGRRVTRSATVFVASSFALSTGAAPASAPAQAASAHESLLAPPLRQVLSAHWRLAPSLALTKPRLMSSSVEPSCASTSSCPGCGKPGGP
jgi:hypothetical protein